jgi:hypothetical protein
VRIRCCHGSHGARAAPNRLWINRLERTCYAQCSTCGLDFKRNAYSPRRRNFLQCVVYLPALY